MTLDVCTTPIQRWNAVFSAGAVAAATAWGSPALGLSVAVGAVVEALNFRGLTIAARGFLAGQLGGRGIWSALFVMRLGVLATVLLLAIRRGAEPVGLLIGLSMILPAAVLGAWQVRPGSDEPGQPLVSAAPPDGPPPPDDPSWDDPGLRWGFWWGRERQDDPEP